MKIKYEEKDIWLIVPNNLFDKMFLCNDPSWANDANGKYGWRAYKVVWDDNIGDYIKIGKYHVKTN